MHHEELTDYSDTSELVVECQALRAQMKAMKLSLRSAVQSSREMVRTSRRSREMRLARSAALLEIR